MKKRAELIAFWLKSAESDLKVATHLLKKKDYHYCLFIGHLALEKTLKALYVKNIDTKVPYKHNLPLLAKKAGIELNDEQESFFEMVSDFNIEEGILPMAERVNRIRKIIKNYIGIMLKNNIKVEKVYLYGSYALGKASGDSDIDIAVVSKDFSGDRFMDRRRIVPLRREVDRRLEPMPYHPDDFKESDPLVLEILQHGLEIL